MFELKKITALAMAGTFAFGVAATTYAAEAPVKELPQAEQPAPQLHKDQKDKMAKEDIIQIDQMGDYEHPAQNARDMKNQPAELDKQQPAPIAPDEKQVPQDLKDQKAPQDQIHQDRQELPQEGPQTAPKPEIK